MSRCSVGSICAIVSRQKLSFWQKLPPTSLTANNCPSFSLIPSPLRHTSTSRLHYGDARGEYYGESGGSFVVKEFRCVFVVLFHHPHPGWFANVFIRKNTIPIILFFLFIIACLKIYKKL
jgi:hypothetical protein